MDLPTGETAARFRDAAAKLREVADVVGGIQSLRESAVSVRVAAARVDLYCDRAEYFSSAEPDVDRHSSERSLPPPRPVPVRLSASLPPLAYAAFYSKSHSEE